MNTEKPGKPAPPKPPPPRTYLLGWRRGQHEPTPFERSLGPTPVRAHLSALHSLVEWATEPSSPALQNADQHLREIAVMTRINPVFTDRPMEDYSRLVETKVSEMLDKSRETLDRACAMMLAHPEFGWGLMVEEKFDTEDFTVPRGSNVYTLICETTYYLSPAVPYGRIAYKRG